MNFGYVLFVDLTVDSHPLFMRHEALPVCWLYVE
jgi:hypothetical protein